jgi:hypothetical protein
MSHLVRDHVLAIPLQRQAAGLRSVHPTPKVQPDLVAPQNCTGQCIVFAAFYFEGSRKTQANVFAPRVFLKGIELCPPIGIGKVNGNLPGEGVLGILDIRIYAGPIIDRLHCLENGKTFRLRINGTMNRITCSLPKALKSLCESGCIYRDPNFKHIQCSLAKKTDVCVAPVCPKPCACKEEMRPVQKKDTYGVQVQMRKYILCHM